MDAAKKMAAGIAKNAPIAVRACKKAINDGLDANMDDAIVIEEKLFGSCFETEDQKAGMGLSLIHIWSSCSSSYERRKG